MVVPSSVQDIHKCPAGLFGFEPKEKNPWPKITQVFKDRSIKAKDSLVLLASPRTNTAIFF